MIRILAALLAASFALAVHAQPTEGRLKKILAAKSIAIAYRADAMPFSFVDTDKQITGYSVDLCTAVVRSIERQYKVQGGLKISWVPVTTQTRFQAVASGKADLECSSSTVTLSRMREVDFSSYIFLESTGVVVRTVSNARVFDDLGNKRIAVVAGTTNERAINAQLKRRGLTATVIPFKTREEGFAAVEDGKADAFASDKLLLVGASAKAKEPGMLVMLSDDLSIEPYAIALPRGDANLRLAVNTALAQVYQSDDLVKIFLRWFGPMGKPAGLLEAMYIFGAIPE